MSAIPIDAFLAEDNISLSENAAETLRAADIITAVDVMSRKEPIIFGRETLEDMKYPASPSHFAIDHDTDELGQLVAMVAAIRGSQDWQSAGG